jgi:hypothetical protein
MRRRVDLITTADRADERMTDDARAAMYAPYDDD